VTTYTFRLRFTLPSPSLSHDSDEIALPLPGHHQHAILRARGAVSIKESTSFIISATQFPSEDAARKAGEKVRDTLRLTCADLRTGLDAAARPSTLGSGKLVLDKAKEMGIELRGDPHGLIVYPDNPNLKFMSISATATVSSPIDRFKERFSKYFVLDTEIDESQTLGLELYSLSHFETSVRARFVTLISAIESTVQPTERSKAAQVLLDSFIEQIQGSALEEIEKKTLINALGNLKTQSITTACRVFVETYGEKDDVTIWQECHATRHKLLHAGKAPKNIGELLPKLDDLVRRILIASVLQKPGAAA